MEAPFVSTSGIAYPDDMELLKRVFDRFCEAHQIIQGGTDAEEIAQAAMSLFQAGVFDEAALWKHLSEFHKQRIGS
jgi:hypothetical protein